VRPFAGQADVPIASHLTALCPVVASYVLSRLKKQKKP
jgi:hypothetical protein